MLYPSRHPVKANIELWHWAKVSMDYALTTYFYIMPPFTNGLVNNPASVQSRVRLSTYETETDGIPDNQITGI